MDKCAAGIAPVVKRDIFSGSQGPRNDLVREEMMRIPYAYAVGSLMYAQVCTRPDLAYVVGMLGRYQSDPGMDHWKPVKKVMRYLQRTNYYMLTFRKTNSLERSIKQGMRASSMMEAEFIACWEALAHALWLRNFISGLQVVDTIRKLLKMYSDNSAAVFFSKNNKLSDSLKLLD
ncbi:secreted RxLR effector protein 161-like [Tasmannia lanceolata]|uniref:secreted RxLR effector protein 161-like n=1 Tax=Tasmannia lanceolata TaxID=3420 RepID=UPI004062AF59